MEPKPPLSLAQQVELLEARGLVIVDKESAASYLHDTNYYRLAGFGRQYQRDPARGDNRYLEGTTFDLLMEACETDTAFSLVLLRCLGVIERAVRSRLALALAMEHGGKAFYLTRDAYVAAPRSDAMPSSRLDENIRRHIETIRGELYRDRGRTITRYAGTDRATLDRVPVWVAVEVLSFGTVSRLLDLLNDTTARDAVAESFGEPRGRFASTIHSLSVFRNRCAHHGQIWHRPLSIHTPVNGKIRKRAQVSFDSQGPYPAVLAIQRLLANSDRGSTPGEEVATFLASASAQYLKGIYRPRPR